MGKILGKIRCTTFDENLFAIEVAWREGDVSIV